MIYWLAGALALEIVIVITGLLMHGPYLRHLRHHHRPLWEDISRKAPRRWRYFKGMPTTGLLISSFIGNPAYKADEERGKLWMGRIIVALNLLHLVILAAVVLLGVWVFALGGP